MSAIKDQEILDEQEAEIDRLRELLGEAADALAVAGRLPDIPAAKAAWINGERNLDA